MKAPAGVLRRYESEVRRLEAWIAQGAATPPAFVSFSTLDPITQRALVYYLPLDTKDDPDPTAPVEITDDEAEVSLEWPGGILLHRLVEHVAANVIPPRGWAKAELEKALATLVKHPPAWLRRPRGRALWLRWYALYGVNEALRDGCQPQPVRIGSSHRGKKGESTRGSKKVTGVPAANPIGYAVYVKQEAPKRARERLLHDVTGLSTDEQRRQVAEHEIEWPTRPTGERMDLPASGMVEAIERAAFGEDELPDTQVVRLAQVLVMADSKERLVLCAESRPERFSLVMTAADLARAPLTREERRVLAADPPNSSKATARLIGWTTATAEAKVNNARSTLNKKIARLGPP
jgi:hypothetical protein